MVQDGMDILNILPQDVKKVQCGKTEGGEEGFVKVGEKLGSG